METSSQAPRPNKMAKHKLELSTIASDKPSKKSSSSSATNNTSSSSSTNTSSLSESSGGGDSPDFNAAASNNNTYIHVQQFSSNEYVSYHYPMSQGTFAPSYDHHIHHHHHNHNHHQPVDACHQQSSTTSSVSSETSLQQPCAANPDSGAFFR